MNTDRKTAIVVGVLFIVATVLSLISTALIGPVTGASNYLASAAAQATQVIIGALVEVAAAVAIILIPAMLFSVLRRQHEGLALGYFGIRMMEAITLVFDAISVLLLVSLGQHYVTAGAPAASSFQVSGAVLLAAHNWAFPLNPVVFGPGALLLNGVLYQTRLIPRWLSAWGLLGAVLVFVMGVVGLFGTTLIPLALPIAVQEMVFALWLIARGFTPSAAPSAPAAHEQGTIGKVAAQVIDAGMH